MEENDPDEYEATFLRHTFKQVVMTMKVKNETYMDESRLKATCQRMQIVDYKAETRRLLTEIAA